MALGKVSVNSVDNGGGEFSAPERQLIYIGHAGKGAGQVLYIDQTTNLDDVLGVNNSRMKTALHFARLNAGPNWTAIAVPRSAIGEWQEGFTAAMQANLVAEGVVVTDAILDKATLADLQAAALSAKNQYGRLLWMAIATAAQDGSQNWAEFIAAAEALQDGVFADRVMLVPEVFDGWLGTVMGRLCNEQAAIADSPMRTASGGIIGTPELPVDSEDSALNLSHMKALNDSRLTVPQTYADYDGIYCSDGQLLAPEGSDFTVIENLRVVDAAARRVRILAIRKLADRKLNSTKASIEAHKKHFMKPLRDMSRSLVIGGMTRPGDVKNPEPGDIEIVWETRTQVRIVILVRPYNAAKAISAEVGLNLE